MFSFFRFSLGKTYNIVLGSGQVVLGMDMGLRDMCVGERRTVIIPPHFGYGETGVGRYLKPHTCNYLAYQNWELMLIDALISLLVTFLCTVP